MKKREQWFQKLSIKKGGNRKILEEYFQILVILHRCHWEPMYPSFLLLNEFITFIVVQWSSQSNFKGFPSHSPSTFHPPHKFFPLETISFSKSVSYYLFCKEVHCVLFSDSTVIWCWCLIVWLISLRMIISKSIHVAKMLVFRSF